MKRTTSHSLWLNKHFARFFMVLLIAVGTIIGSGTSLARLRQQATDIFINGATGNGIGVASDMAKNVAAARNMLTVAGRYLDDRDSTVVDVARDADNLEGAISIADKIRYNGDVTRSVLKLSDKLLAIGVSDSDARYCRNIPIDMEENNRRMARDPYNSKAAEINSVLDTFPANILKHVTNNKNIEVFGVN